MTREDLLFVVSVVWFVTLCGAVGWLLLIRPSPLTLSATVAAQSTPMLDDIRQSARSLAAAPGFTADG